jgi:hypothetical protein
MVGDTLLASLLLFDLLLFLVTSSRPYSQMKAWFIAVPVDVAMTAPLVFRRKYPHSAAYLVFAVGIAHSALHLGVATLAAGAIALYTLVVYGGRRQAGCYLGAQAAGAAVQLALTWTSGNLVVATIVALTFAFCWVLGEFVGGAAGLPRRGRSPAAPAGNRT